MKDVVGLYNKKRSVFAGGSAPCAVHTPDSFACSPVAVVIPACAEYPGILPVFEALCTAAHPPSVFCVVNHRRNASGEVKENNARLVKAAAQYRVCVLDCTHSGCELKENEGVGSARRIGMDYALRSGARVIACMDADTTVCPFYGYALYDFFLHCAALEYKGKLPLAGGITRFTHQKAENKSVQRAINAYEFFIKEHSLRLYTAGTPFYPYALGPAIVCSAWGYAAAGGMNRRISGEDFYFLQALIKINMQQALLQCCDMRRMSCCGSDKIPEYFIFPELDCTVYPQARLSGRTLFGTGQKLSTLTKNDTAALSSDSLMYPDSVYEKITHTISLLRGLKTKPEHFAPECRTYLRDVYDFLEKEKFFRVWDNLCTQNRGNANRLETAFHTWFDGLKILRLIHYLMR